MNYYALQEYKKDVYPAIILDEILSISSRKIIRRIIVCFALIFFVGSFLPVQIVEGQIFLLRAIYVFLFCIYIYFLLYEAMYRSYYFEENKVDIRILKILHSSKRTDDLTALFLNHELGMNVLYRLGFTKSEIEVFLKNKTDFVTKNEFEIIENNDSEVSFTEFGFSLLHFDMDLANLLRKKGITVADFKQTLEWVSRVDQSYKESKRWWALDKLLRIPSVGKNLSFGQVYYLERLGHSIFRDTAYVQLGEKWRTYKTSVNKIEAVLSKLVDGNILLTAKEAYLTMDALASFAKEIQQGTVLANLENKRMYVVDVNLLISTYEEKTDFENVFENILQQAASAGNVILVIPDFPDFVQNTYTLGIDIKDIIREALQSSRLHIIATANERAFHEILETDLDLMSHFEKIHLDEFDEYQAISILQNEVLYLEHKENIFFTYQAVKRIVESADRYFADTSLLDKSIDILYEIVPVIKKQGVAIVTQDHVDSLVMSKTGITLGKISKDESYKLAHIQEEMHTRVIGQEIAISAVCDAMLRARTGLANPKRPLASFLFVGPTGVGKTETAKALASIFFNDEENMLRVDMSEYSDQDALTRMIGQDGHVGIFASKIRERGHGVLLLDEFEKASFEVHDLFLQILDEGFFTDGRGERIGVRNFIIIATSNAGSDLFAQYDGSLVKKEEILNYVIAKHVLRTELLNRFDDVIVYQSLTQDMVSQIVHLAIKRLAQRLEQKGIILKETPEFVEYLRTAGTSSKFGAREINRVIIKEVESKIAQALVLGDLFEGDTISFTVVSNELEIQKYT